MTTASTGPSAPPPATILVLWPVMIIRTVLAAGTLVASLSVLPGLVERSQRRLVNQRTGQIIEPIPQLKAILVAAAVFGGVFGAAYVAAWLWVGRRAVRGVRWAAVGVAVLSGLGVLGVVSTAVFSTVLDRVPNLTYAYDYPTWVLGVSALQAVADLAVVVLLVLPASRAWIRALNPPAPLPRPTLPPGTPPWPPSGYGPPDPGRRH